MKMKKIILVGIVLFVFGIGGEVRALETDEVDYNVLNEYSDNINFLEDNTMTMYGSLGSYLTSDDIISYIDVDYLTENYNISSIYIVDDDNNSVSNVVSGNKLVIEIVSEDEEITSVEYSIMVIGDINGDSIVNDDDVCVYLDSLLNNEDVSVVNDINGDGVFDVMDLSYLVSAIDGGSWDIDSTNSDSLSGVLSNSTDIYINDTISIKYEIYGLVNDSINGLSGLISYDSNYLELVSIDVDSRYGDIDSDGSFVYILNPITSDGVIITYNFKAVKVGDVTVSLDNLMLLMDGIKLGIDDDSIYTDITINNYGTGGDGFDEEEEDEDEDESTVTTVSNSNSSSSSSSTNSVVSTNNYSNTYDDSDSNYTVTYVTLSSDNYIESLVIDGYDIDFDRETLNYTIDVDYSVKSLDLEVILSSDSASYEISGNSKFKTGENIVSIVVTAEDGSERTYTITVNREEKVEDEEEEEESSNFSKIIIVILIVLIIIGLIYVIFRDDEEDEKNS